MLLKMLWSLFESCPNIDIIVRDDGEKKLSKSYLKRVPPYEVTGLSYRVKGKIFHNPNQVFPTINNVLYPNRALRRYKYKISLNGFNLGIKFDTISSSRGCPFNCKFCTFSMNPYGIKRE